METFDSFCDMSVSLCKKKTKGVTSCDASTQEAECSATLAERAHTHTHTHLAGKQLQYEVTVSLNFRRARSRLQLEPGVVADDWDLLRKGNWPVSSANGGMLFFFFVPKRLTGEIFSDIQTRSRSKGR